MSVTTSTNGESQEGEIQSILQFLRKQIDQYDLVDEDERWKGDVPRSERIEQLMMEEKRLSEANEKMRKQLKHYEKRYEKALKKKVKAMKMHLEDGQQKLEVIKQRCQELDKALGGIPYKVGKQKKTGKKLKGNNSIIKVKTMKPKHYKQTTLPVTKQIKIKISRNEELGNREMHFVNGGNNNGTSNGTVSGNALDDLVEIVRPKTVVTRECKIMLQRLTDEQMKKLYNRNEKSPGKPNQTPKKKPRNSPQKVDENGLSVSQPKWHIKIPKSVFEESQKEIDLVSPDVVTDLNCTA